MTRKMKDSGIEWIGEIPEGWNTGKCKTILVANDGGVWGDDPVGDGTDKTVIRSTEQTIDGKWCIENPAKRDLSRVEYRKARIEENDLLITKSSGSDLHIGKTTIADTYFRDNECYYSNFIQRIRCADYSPKLLWYLFNSPIIREQCVFLQNTTSGIGNINANIIQNLLIPIPPLSTQHRITSYLDTQCAKIDAVLEQTRQSIEEYKRLKQAVITRAVTKGIRPGRKMKDSGDMWLGDIPEEWKLSRVGLHFDIILGKMLCSVQLSDDYSLEPYYCAANIHFDGISNGEMKQMWFSSTEKTQYLVKPGDLLVVEGGAGAGGCAIVKTVSSPVYIQNSVMIVRPKRNAEVRYLRYLLESLVKAGYIDIVCNKATIPHFTKDKLANVPFPVSEEQEQIADYLDVQVRKMEDIIGKKEGFLAELESYKKSLIYECVMGKKDV